MVASAALCWLCVQEGWTDRWMDGESSQQPFLIPAVSGLLLPAIHWRLHTAICMCFNISPIPWHFIISVSLRVHARNLPSYLAAIFHGFSKKRLFSGKASCRNICGITQASTGNAGRATNITTIAPVYLVYKIREYPRQANHQVDGPYPWQAIVIYEGVLLREPIYRAAKSIQMISVWGTI